MRRLVIVSALGLASWMAGAASAADPVVATPEPPPVVITPAPAAAVAPEPSPAVEVEPTVDLELLTGRARDLVAEDNLEAALATANKAPEGEARDNVLSAIIAEQIAVGDVPEALTVAAKISDPATRAELVESLGRMLTEPGAVPTEDEATTPGGPDATDEGQGVAATPAPPGVSDDTVAPTPADRRELIMAVQDRLNELGFSVGRSDGVAGRRTERAVREFQRLAGIPEDAEVTPELYDALDEAVADERYVRFGTEGALIGPPFSNVLRGRLTHEDLLEAAEAISFALDELGPGETVDWRRGSTEGEVVLESHFESTDPPGRPCHRFAHTITVDGMTETADRVTVCRDPVEGWRFVDRDAP